MTWHDFTDTVHAGASYDLTVYDKQADGTAVDLTGATARFQARRTPGDSTAVVDLTSTPAAGLTITPLEGRIDIAMTPTQTSAMAGTYVAQLELAWANGRVDRIFSALLNVSPEVVR